MKKYAVPKPPNGAQKNAMSRILTVSYDNGMVRDRMSVTINHL